MYRPVYQYSMMVHTISYSCLSQTSYIPTQPYHFFTLCGVITQKKKVLQLCEIRLVRSSVLIMTVIHYTTFQLKFPSNFFTLLICHLYTCIAIASAKEYYWIIAYKFDTKCIKTVTSLLYCIEQFMMSVPLSECHKA